MERRDKWKTLIGWFAVGITLVISIIWAYWGIVENFHEGWYSTSVWENLFMLFLQYIGFPIVFVVLSLVALKWPWVGFGIYIAAAIFVMIFFGGAHFSVVYLMLAIPLIGLGLLFLFGRLQPLPLKYAKLGIVILPLLVMIIAGIPGAVRVSQRVDDGDYGKRTVEGNGITLIWAPRGPGWPNGGISWEDAQNRSIYLAENGTVLMDTPQNIWRVPSIDEMVRSQCLHGTQVGGVWDNETKTASYEKSPDKETPLWESHSHVIYYWTGTEISETQAYMIVYDGGVFAKDKSNSYPYLSFRAVKTP